MADAEITKIEAQKRQGRYNVYLDGQYAFPVSDAVLVQFRLAKGMTLSDQQQAQIGAADQASQAYQLALNYLSHQLRTEFEIRHYLKEHEIPLAVRHSVVKRLQELRLLNDQTYADSYVRTAKLTTDKGPIVIRQKLKQKGVADLQIETALAQYTQAELVENGVKVAAKLAKHYQRQSFQQQQQKVKTSLRQKGFNGDLITLIMAQLDLQPDTEQEQVAFNTQAEKAWRQTARYSGQQRRLKMKQKLYQKGFAFDLIEQFLDLKEQQDGLDN